jgi:hypothetical protein
LRESALTPSVVICEPIPLVSHIHRLLVDVVHADQVFTVLRYEFVRQIVLLVGIYTSRIVVD